MRSRKHGAGKYGVRSFIDISVARGANPSLSARVRRSGTRVTGQASTSPIEVPAADGIISVSLDGTGG
jgi:hypothetical protein